MNRQIAGRRRSRRRSVGKTSRRRSKVSGRRSKCNRRSSRKSCRRRSKGKKRCSWVKRKSKGRRKSRAYCRRMTGGSRYVEVLEDQKQQPVPNFLLKPPPDSFTLTLSGNTYCYYINDKGQSANLYLNKTIVFNKDSIGGDSKWYSSKLKLKLTPSLSKKNCLNLTTREDMSAGHGPDRVYFFPAYIKFKVDPFPTITSEGHSIGQGELYYAQKKDLDNANGAYLTTNPVSYKKVTVTV